MNANECKAIILIFAWRSKTCLRAKFFTSFFVFAFFSRISRISRFTPLQYLYFFAFAIFAYFAVIPSSSPYVFQL